MDSMDLIIINWIRNFIHASIPFTNIYFEGFAIGETTFWLLLLFLAGEAFLMITGKKAVKK